MQQPTKGFNAPVQVADHDHMRAWYDEMSTWRDYTRDLAVRVVGLPAGYLYVHDWRVADGRYDEARPVGRWR